MRRVIYYIYFPIVKRFENPVRTLGTRARMTVSRRANKKLRETRDCCADSRSDGKSLLRCCKEQIIYKELCVHERFQFPGIHSAYILQAVE